MASSADADAPPTNSVATRPAPPCTAAVCNGVLPGLNAPSGAPGVVCAGTNSACSIRAVSGGGVLRRIAARAAPARGAGSAVRGSLLAGLPGTDAVVALAASGGSTGAPAPTGGPTTAARRTRTAPPELLTGGWTRGATSAAARPLVSRALCACSSCRRRASTSIGEGCGSDGRPDPGAACAFSSSRIFLRFMACSSASGVESSWGVPLVDARLREGPPGPLISSDSLPCCGGRFSSSVRAVAL